MDDRRGRITITLRIRNIIFGDVFHISLLTCTDNDRTCEAVIHGDCYVTIILYLHRTPAYPSACYIMIIVDCATQQVQSTCTLQ